MEGFSIITYKNKQIQYSDFTDVGIVREKLLQLFDYSLAQCLSQPPNTVLSLTNFTNFQVDMGILNIYRNRGADLAQYKKIAVIGLAGFLSIAYNIFINLVKEHYSLNIKVFSSELEAKEWLVSD